MIIELYGLPGSGKTTYAENLAREKGIEIIRIKKKTDLIFFNFLFLFMFPIKFFILFFYVLINSTNIKMFYYKFMNTFLHHNAKYIKAVFFRRDTDVIIDQGHFQNIISVFEKNLSQKSLKKYLNFLPKKNNLVIFDIPQNIRFERLSKRDFVMRSDFNQSYRQKWFQVIEYNDSLLKSNLNLLKNSFVLKKNN